MTRVQRCTNGACRDIAARYSYGIWPDRRVALLCDRCKRHLEEIGMSLTPEHRDDPNRADRTPRPAWLGRVRDMTGALR